MKSIVQEASTIAKAVELGWREAGEPQEFSVKILEIPQHNFLGMTTRSAKVAVIFDSVVKISKSDKSPKQPPQKQRPAQASTPRASREKIKEPKQRTQQPKKETARPDRQEPIEKKVEVAPQKTSRRKPEGLWNDELVACAQDWLTTSIKHMDKHDITFTIEPQNFYLRITLNKPILKDEAKEKHLLASLSSLMLATVKKQFRKALRGHKIVLTHAQ